jgi:hypothetical protein
VIAGTQRTDLFRAAFPRAPADRGPIRAGDAAAILRGFDIVPAGKTVLQSPLASLFADVFQFVLLRAHYAFFAHPAGTSLV